MTPMVIALLVLAVNVTWLVLVIWWGIRIVRAAETTARAVSALEARSRQPATLGAAPEQRPAWPG